MKPAIALALLCGSLWGQATIPPQAEEQPAALPDSSPIGAIFCVLAAHGTRERHAWVPRTYFADHLATACYSSPSMTKTKTGWRLSLNGYKITINQKWSDSEAKLDSVLATEIVP